MKAIEENGSSLPTGVRVIHGDCLEELRKLPAESVHCCVTSPPYWGLRDYGIPDSIWPAGEGEELNRKGAEVAEGGCAHVWRSETVKTEVGKGNWAQGTNGRGEAQPGGVAAKRVPIGAQAKRAFCRKCGAWRGVLGLEPTPELYVAHVVMVFREVRRVLRKDGTLWVNLGDSYAGGGNGGGGSFAQDGIRMSSEPGTNKNIPHNRGARRIDHMRKSGDLVGIPWLVALALQADGWWLRRDNIWHKPAPMPEGVNGVRWERCRVKIGASEREKTTNKKGDKTRGQKPHGAAKARDALGNAAFTSAAKYRDCGGCAKCAATDGLVLRKGNWRCTTAHEYVFQFSKSANYFCNAEEAKEVSGSKPSGNKARKFRSEHGGNPGLSNAHQGFAVPWHPSQGGRNRRSVWTIHTRPFKGAHFATFPPALIEPIIRVATAPVCCGECGAPFAPVMVEKRVSGYRATCRCHSPHFTGGKGGNGERKKDEVPSVSSVGSCSKPSVVLDPFAGSGTVGMVARSLGREAVLIELAAHYLPLIEARVRAGRAEEKGAGPRRGTGKRKRVEARQTELFTEEKAA